jgi:hypothetical protein
MITASRGRSICRSRSRRDQPNSRRFGMAPQPLEVLIFANGLKVGGPRHYVPARKEIGKMRTIVGLFVVLVLIAVSPNAVQGQEQACVTCQNGMGCWQDCVIGGGGSGCDMAIIWDPDYQAWCRYCTWYGSCEPGGDDECPGCIPEWPGFGWNAPGIHDTAPVFAVLQGDYVVEVDCRGMVVGVRGRQKPQIDPVHISWHLNDM